LLKKRLRLFLTAVPPDPRELPRGRTNRRDVVDDTSLDARLGEQHDLSKPNHPPQDFSRNSRCITLRESLGLAPFSREQQISDRQLSKSDPHYSWPHPEPE
jgi:hypothetical protein